MLASHQQSASSDGATSQNPVQTESDDQGSRDFDPFFGDMAPDGLGGAAPPEHLHGGFDNFYFNHGWLPESNIAGQPAHNFPEINVGGSQPPSMNQGFNSLIPSHTVAQEHQWNPGNRFAPSNPSLNNFGSPNVFDPTAFSTAANVAGLGKQNQFSGATANNQSTSSGPPPEVVTTNLRRESVDESELQVTNLPPSAVRGIELASPRPTDGEITVQVRRDTLVILCFNMQSLSSGSATYDGLKIPSTPSVTRKGSEAGKKLLFLQIRVFGATTKALYETLCHKCKDRAGDKDAFPDYRARSNILPQKNGRVPVAFTLACCSKHREPQDSEYRLEVVLNGGPEPNIPFIQYELPYSFSIVSKLPPRTRHQGEGVDAIDAVAQPPLKLPRTDSGHAGRIGNPASHSTGPSGSNPLSSGDSRGPTNSTPSGTSENPVPFVDNHHSASPAEPLMLSQQCRQTVNTAGVEETADWRDLVIDRTNPSRGPTTGGPEVWISGSNFPTGLTSLYVRFGDNFARAVAQKPDLLSCFLPQANVPGRVSVALSRSPIPSAPVLGTSLCHFEYFTDLNEMLPVIIRIQEDCTPEVAAALDILHKEMKKRNLKRNEKRPLREEEARHDEIETAIIQALAPLQNTLDFGELISKTNDYKQTLAHFAVLFGYTNLLRRLVGWNIDLTIADFNGFTALHCAYKKGDRVCVDLLLEKGASETVLDALGRAPSHLMPEGFASLNDYDTDMTPDGQPKLEQKHDAPSLLHSGHGVSDPGDEKSMSHTDLIKQMFDQTETGSQHASDLPSISDDPNVEHFGNFGPSANRDTTAIPLHSIPEPTADNGVRTCLANNRTFQMRTTAPMDTPLPNSGLLGPLPTPNELGLNQEEGTVGIPKWIAFIKPLPQDGEKVITLRRDHHLALDIILEHLPKRPPAGCNGIKIPATSSVRHFADTTGKTLLEFRIRLYGATTHQPYELVCASCEKREGKLRGTPDLIDFKTDSDMIEPKDGNIRVEFVFCCYPKDHGLGDTEYLLEVVLSEDESQKHIVAQCRLPFSFDVVPKFRTMGEKALVEQGDFQAPEPHAVRRKRDPQIDPPSYEEVFNLAPGINHQDVPEVVPTYKDSTRSPLLLAPTLEQSPSADSSSAPLDAAKPPNRAIAPSRIDEECASTLTDVHPECGSIASGARIWQTATHGVSIGVQSSQVNRQAPHLAGFPLQAPMTSQTEPQATRNPSAITSHPRYGAVVNGIGTSPTNNQGTQARPPIPAPAPDEDQDEGNLRMPDWLALVKPSPTKVITMRRETHVALDILLERLPRQPPGGYNGIKVPATASVRNFAETSGRPPLEFRIYVTGAASNRRYETVCVSCEKREGKKKGTPSFIDFFATNEFIEQKDGKARVEFVFCCYPKCHQDNGYFLDVVLSEDVNQTNIVAQYRLPFLFRVVAKLPQGKRRTKGQMEQPEEPLAVDQRNDMALFDDLTQRGVDDERNDHPMPAINPWNAGQYREGDSSSASPLAVSFLRLLWNAGPKPGPVSPWEPPNPAIAPPSTDGETVQSSQVDRQAPHLAGFPLQAPMTSQTEPQATRNPSAITSHPRYGAVVNGIGTSPTNNQGTQARPPIPAPAPDEDQDEGNLRMPDWLTLVRPSPMKVITLRRDTRVALDILLERLPRQPPGGYNGIKVPATASVRNFAETSGRPPLEFRIYVTGAASNRRYETVCASCEWREGKKRGTPSFIDFFAANEFIEQKDGKARAEFTFCCYPKCHQDSGYFLDVVLSEDVNQTNIVAQYRLPFLFRVVAKLPQGMRRTRDQMVQPEEPLAVDQRNVRARVDDLTQRGADDEQNDHPMPAMNPRNAGQYRSSSASPPAVSSPQSLWNAGPNPGPVNPWKPSNPAIAPPSTDREIGPTVTEVNPESGSITGGARIWLKGIDFPVLFPLYARFGTTVVPTTFAAGNLLVCNLPPATMPGLVDVTLSKHPQPSAPEFGTSIAKFQYIGDHDQFSIRLRIQGQGYPEFSPVLKEVLSSLNGPQPNRGLQGDKEGVTALDRETIQSNPA